MNFSSETDAGGEGAKPPKPQPVTPNPSKPVQKDGDKKGETRNK